MDQHGSGAMGSDGSASAAAMPAVPVEPPPGIATGIQDPVGNPRGLSPDAPSVATTMPGTREGSPDVDGPSRIRQRTTQREDGSYDRREGFAPRKGTT